MNNEIGSHRPVGNQNTIINQNIVNVITTNTVSPKSRTIALITCIFFGIVGAHRFYVGKSGTAVLWMLTLGCFGFGWIIDIIQIACGNFTDNTNTRITDWKGVDMPLKIAIILTAFFTIFSFAMHFITLINDGRAREAEIQITDVPTGAMPVMRNG